MAHGACTALSIVSSNISGDAEVVHHYHLVLVLPVCEINATARIRLKLILAGRNKMLHHLIRNTRHFIV
jgi:hypothetical protein